MKCEACAGRGVNGRGREASLCFACNGTGKVTQTASVKNSINFLASRQSGRQTTLPPAFAALAAALGGVEALATACGVSSMTVWRWGRGTRPGPLVVKAVNAMAKRRGLEPPFGDT